MSASTLTRLRPTARKAAISITQAASSRIHSLLSAQRPPVLGIRLGVRTRGCNGLSYTLNYVDEAKLPTVKNDEIVDSDGVKLYIDPKALFYVVGTTMDYVENDLASEFVFKNPNEKGKCGCGESFNV